MYIIGGRQSLEIQGDRVQILGIDLFRNFRYLVSCCHQLYVSKMSEQFGIMFSNFKQCGDIYVNCNIKHLKTEYLAISVVSELEVSPQNQCGLAPSRCRPQDHSILLKVFVQIQTNKGLSRSVSLNIIHFGSSALYRAEVMQRLKNCLCPDDATIRNF